MSCIATLERSTDWAAIYARLLAFSIVDPIFHAERFGKVPIKLLQACIEQLSENKQETINAQSISTAKLSSFVIAALGGKNTKVNMEELLPYAMKKECNGLQKSTIAAMKWALKNEPMPPAIIGLIGSEFS